MVIQVPRLIKWYWRGKKKMGCLVLFLFCLFFSEFQKLAFLKHVTFSLEQNQSEHLLLFFPKIKSTFKHAFWKSFFKTTLNMVNQTCPIVFVSRSKKLNIKLLLQLTLCLSKGLFVLFLLLFQKLAFVLNMNFWNKNKRNILKHDFWKHFFKTT